MTSYTKLLCLVIQFLSYYTLGVRLVSWVLSLPVTDTMSVSNIDPCLLRSSVLRSFFFLPFLVGDTN